MPKKSAAVRRPCVARLPVRAGYEYLADAVVLRAVEPKRETDAQWQSLWASLTFAVPAK